MIPVNLKALLWMLHILHFLLSFVEAAKINKTICVPLSLHRISGDFGGFSFETESVTLEILLIWWKHSYCRTNVVDFWCICVLLWVTFPYLNKCFSGKSFCLCWNNRIPFNCIDWDPGIICSWFLLVRHMMYWGTEFCFSEINGGLIPFRKGNSKIFRVFWSHHWKCDTPKNDKFLDLFGEVSCVIFFAEGSFI